MCMPEDLDSILKNNKKNIMYRIETSLSYWKTITQQVCDEFKWLSDFSSDKRYPNYILAHGRYTQSFVKSFSCTLGVPKSGY